MGIRFCPISGIQCGKECEAGVLRDGYVDEIFFVYRYILSENPRLNVDLVMKVAIAAVDAKITDICGRKKFGAN